MRMLKINQETVYFCKKYTTNGIELFNMPVSIDVTPITLSSDYSAETIGFIESGKLVFAVDRDEYEDYFSLGDRFYVYKTYTDFDGSAQDADYVLSGINKTPTLLSIVLTRLAV